MKTNTILLFITVLFLASCKKESSEQYAISRLPYEVHQANSEWVYCYGSKTTTIENNPVVERPVRLYFSAVRDTVITCEIIN